MTRSFLAHYGLGFILTMLVAWTLIRLWPRKSTDILERLRDRYHRVNFILRTGFWGAFASVAIDADHITRLFGHPNGRVWHIPVAIGAAWVLVWNLIEYFLRAKLSKTHPEMSELVIYKNVFWICIALCLIAHVVEDFWLNWF